MVRQKDEDVKDETKEEVMAETKEEEIIDASGVENEAPDVQASGENEPVKEIQDTVGLQEDKKNESNENVQKD